MPKVALITGAARRIGAACARLLHQEGYDVLLHYHTSQAPAQSLVNELNVLRPHSAHLQQADLLDLSHRVLSRNPVILFPDIVFKDSVVEKDEPVGIC